MRILIAKAPPMLRSILKAALGELPEAEVEELEEDVQAVAADDQVEVIAKKISETNADLAVIGSSGLYEASFVRDLLRKCQNIKVLMIDERGQVGCLYYLRLRKLWLRELSFGAIREALIEDD